MSLALPLPLTFAFFFLAFRSPVYFIGLLLLLYSPFKVYMTDTRLFPMEPGGTLGDMALMAAGLYILTAYLRGMPRWRLPKSLHVAIMLFILYGAFSVLKGFYHFGYPSIGEARKNLLFIVFAFYGIAAFRQPDDIVQMLRRIYRVAIRARIISLAVILENYMLTVE